MKRLSSALTLLLLQGPGLGLGAAWAAPVSVGRAVVIMGEVEMRSADGTVTALKTGDTLFAHSVIKTGADSRAKLLFEDNSVIDLGTKSDFTVEEFALKSGGDRQVTLSMGSGKIRSSVTEPVGAKGRFVIRTKTASMGVRGTEFVVASGPLQMGMPEERTEVTVLEGKVEVTDHSAKDHAPYSVGQGQQYSGVARVSGDRAVASAGGETPKVVQLSQSQLAAVTADVKIEDKSFKEPKRKSGKDGGQQKKDGSSKEKGDKSDKSESKKDDKGDKSESKKDDKSDKAESKKDDAKSESKSDSKAESKSESSSESKSESKAESKSDSSSESKSEAKSEAKSDSSSESKSEAKSEAKSESKSESREPASAPAASSGSSAASVSVSADTGSSSSSGGGGGGMGAAIAQAVNDSVHDAVGPSAPVVAAAPPSRPPGFGGDPIAVVPVIPKTVVTDWKLHVVFKHN